MKDPVLEMSFAAGIDQSQRAELLDPRAGFVSQENVRAPSIGAVCKRAGFGVHAGATLSDETTRTAGYRQFPYGKQTCIIDGGTICGVSPQTGTQINLSRVPECGLSMVKLPTGSGRDSLICTDADVVGDYLVLAYTSSSEAAVYAAIVEMASGMTVMPPTKVHAGAAGEIIGLVCHTGTTAMIFVTEGSVASIYETHISCASASTIAAGWSTSAAAITDSDGFLRMDACSLSDRIAVAYVNNSGGASQVTVATFSAAAALLDYVHINTASTTPTAIGIEGSVADTLWVGWNQSSNVKLTGLDADDLGTTLATPITLISAASGPSDIGSIAICSSSTAGAGRMFVQNAGICYARSFTTSGGAVAADGSTVPMINVYRIGKPFRVGSRYYAPCRGSDASEQVVILCDLSESNRWVRPVANVAPRLSKIVVGLSKTPARTATEYWCPVSVLTAGTVYSTYAAVFDFAADARWRPVEHNGVTFLSGGVIGTFDGARFAESNFLVRPPAPELSTDGTGSFTATVGISCILVYEQVDSAGNWHVSGVSSPTNSGAFSNKVNLVVTYRPLGISARISATTDPSVRISLYATEDGGTLYYHVTSFTNSLSSATGTYNMTAAGGSGGLFLNTGALPNTGAQLDRRAPQGMQHLCSYNGFLIAACDEEVRWTAQDVDGEGAWWNDNFSQAVSGGGRIEALDQIDGTLYAFKRDRIFAMAGSPPNDSGSEGGLGPPQRLAGNVGAVSPFTLSTEIGIFFVADRGIHLLTRNRTVEFIGEKIQDTFDDFPHVSSMTYDPVSSCVLIEASEGRSAGLPTGNGRTFVYDLKARAWRSFDRRAVSTSADVPAADGCMVWTGSEYRYAWLRSDGVSYVETSAHKLDPGDVRVRMYAKTSCVHVAGIQGEQNIEGVLLLGEHVEDHDLKVGVANDYASTFDDETRDSDALAAMPIYNPHFDIAQQTGQSVQVEIEDAAPTGTASDDGEGDAALWVALTFIGTPKAGVKRTSAVLRGGT